MSATSVTLAGRAAAERLMVDTCTITRQTGHTTNLSTGVITATTVTVYAGKCRVKQVTGGGQPASSGSDSGVGEASLALVPYQLQLPMSATGLGQGDRATVTASALDPDLVGRVFVLDGVAAGTHLTMRRYQVREVTS